MAAKKMKDEARTKLVNSNFAFEKMPINAKAKARSAAGSHRWVPMPIASKAIAEKP